MRGKTERLSDALARALPTLDLAQRRKESLAMACWPEVVGEATAARSRPLHVNRGVMVVKVASAAWSQQLSLLKGRYLEALARRVGAGVIQDLRWRVGALDRAEDPLDLSRPRRNRAEPPRLPGPPAEVVARVEAQVRVIRDPRVAAQVRRAWLRAASVQEARRAAGWQPCDTCGILHDPLADGGRCCPMCNRPRP
ncbi:MAG: DUF721 domain-containing protein [Candidatus Sericytochromatia bacterium]|nr:DUF721 domain-containing protein [Candidatus Sericytochromatia bacterium]